MQSMSELKDDSKGISAARDPAILAMLRRPAIASVAVTVLFGLSSVRALLPQMSFLLRDRLGWNAFEIGRAGLGLFCVGFTVALLARLLGVEGKLLLCTLTLPLARLAAQIWQGDPIADLVLQTIATAAFFLALAALAAVLRAVDGGGGCLAVGWLVGLLADTALHGLYGTWDLVWRRDGVSLLVQTVLVVAAVSMTLRFWWLWRRAGRPHGDLSAYAAWGWLGLGPLLFLLVAQLANPGRYAMLLGESADLAWLLIAASQMTALVVVTAWLRRGGSPGVLLLPPAAIVLTVLLWPAWPTGGQATLQVFLGGLLALLLFAVVLISIDAGPLESLSKSTSKSPAGDLPRRLAWSHGATILVFGLLLFTHGAALDVRMPMSTDRLFAVAAALLGLAAFGAGGVLHEYSPPERRGWRPWQAAGLVLALPALASVWAPTDSASHREVSASQIDSLRVMTYNLHCGVDPRGDLGLEALAVAIEEEDPHVVALQEVSRGWTVNGSLDMVGWLAERLGMQFAFAGTADPLWGNAVLSRLPILAAHALDLPSEYLKLKRGSLDVTVGLGGGASLRLLATHLHHRSDGSEVRQRQVVQLLEQWNGSAKTIILGDLNARPETPEIAALLDAGLIDTFARAGMGQGLTFPSAEPIKRIDYIWLSPDLEVVRAAVPATLASDHLPVLAEVRVPESTF